MKRLVSFFLSVVLILMLMPVVPVSAVGFQETPVIDYTDMNSVSSWNSYFSSLLAGLGVLSEIPLELMWEAMDNSLSKVVPGKKTDVRSVASSMSGVNSRWLTAVDVILDTLLREYPSDALILDIDVGFDEVLGVYRPYDKTSGLPIVNSMGQFPYYVPVILDPDTGEEVDDPALGGKWVRVDKVSGYKNVINEATLNDLVVALATSGESIKMEVFQDRYKGIQSKTRFENGIPFVYCDSQSRQYVMLLDENQWAVDDSNDYYTGTGGDGIYNEGDTENNTLIDIDTNTAWFPDGTLSFIDNLILDESTKTYYVDAHQEYDIDNNIYITNNYHYEYHIDYTSITYIGQTEEYNKTYELYYQLPDGRSSADLTAEELLALNTQIDVLPYIRSADDTSIRALYHFDGDTLDSSYWSHLGEFKWNKGASITYMDVGAFNGALYLDENEHSFDIKLPSNVGTSDFTLQFRLYQSGTPTPVSDSTIGIGEKPLFSLDGETLKTGAGYLMSDMPVGTWNEIAFVRHAGNTYWYLNGVSCVTGTSLASFVFGDTLTFSFGSDQQTFKYFDELRFVNKALYLDGESYTPTSVPYDTNLALVLPDSKLPVADEYWAISSSGNLLTQYDLDVYYGTDISSTSYIKKSTSTFSPETYSGYYGYAGIVNSNPSSSAMNVNFPNFGYFSKYTTLNYDSAGLLIDSNLPSSFSYESQIVYKPSNLIKMPSGSVNIGIMPSAGLFSLVHTTTNSVSSQSQYYLPAGTYTMSLVLGDGSVTSVTFDVANHTKCYDTTNSSSPLLSAVNGTVITSEQVAGYEFGYMSTYAEFFGTGNFRNWGFIFVRPIDGDTPTQPIVYMDLVEGISSDLSAEFVSSVVVMDKDDLNTPSLAVRTDLEITGHQIGGVRPSLPEKGLVWAMVESGRITSLQIYNGQAWEQVDGRIWTGSRWVPYYAYDLLLLKDLYDIVESDPSLDYIYTEAGFWKWLQNAWGEMMKKLDQIITLLGGTPGTGTTCEHVYDSKITREPGCVEPGNRTYTCSKCQHTYVELIDATGHDWIVTNSVPDVLDEDGSVVEEGYDELTCSVCDTVNRDYGDGPEEVDLFDALGDFIADGITWILDKLTELADSLRGITEIFNSFRDKIAGMAGGFPLFFAGFVALLPEDLMAVFWFAVIGFIILAVWKKWSN